MNATAQDVRQTLSGTNPPSNALLLDYVNRVSLEMLGISKWIFLLAPPQSFITQSGVTNYWVGPINTGPFNAADTLLNLTDLRSINDKSVIDRSNFRKLGKTDDAPTVVQLSFPDSTSRPGRPDLWRQDAQSPNVLNIYPAPDNQNTYQPQPETPICTNTIGGSLPARLYFVTVTFVDSFGNESTAPYATQVYLPANVLLKVNPPSEPLSQLGVQPDSAGVQYDRYNVYAASAATNERDFIPLGNLTLQASLISTSVPWVEPTSGLTTTGPEVPTQNNVQPLGGYVIEFRYFRQRIQLTSASQVIQIPDDYKHVVIAGVNALAFMYLTRPQEALRWYSLYQDGLTKIIRDINFMARGPGYFQVDAAATGNTLQDVETLDLGFLVP